MTISTFVLDTIDRERDKCVALTDPMVIDAAMRLSFYVAMLDAAKDDPMDDEEDQRDMLLVLENRIAELTEKYQHLVNQLI